MAHVDRNVLAKLIQAHFSAPKEMYLTVRVNWQKAEQ